MKLIITVDTEADNQWKQTEALLYANIQTLPRFDTLCRAYEKVVTYLTTYDVVADATAATILKQLYADGAEIGAHLHSWSTPPLPENVSSYVFSTELDDTTITAQLEQLTDKITTVIGAAPTSFRGGRWSFDERIAIQLARLGYVVDSSVTPGVNWQRIITKGTVLSAPNYATNSILPLVLTYTQPPIVEVPMTIVQRQIMHSYPKIAQYIHAMPVFFKHFVQHIAKPRWLRIFPETTAKDLILVYTKAKSLGLPAVVFMIHSSELLVGGSPYSKNSQQVAHI